MVLKITSLSESELSEIARTVTSGSGYVVLPSIFSQEASEAAYNVIVKANRSNVNEVKTSYGDIRQNHYSGILYGLLSYGEIFQEFAANPILLQISNRILGENSRLSSLSSNTIVKGMESQNPHCDYPYHRNLWPSQEHAKSAPITQLASVTFITALTDLTPENGSTALVPGSQVNFDFPDDHAAFERKSVQITAKRGDMLVMAGSMQHCSRTNKTESPRCAILQQMISLYVNPFEDFSDFENYVPKNDQLWTQLLALRHPLPKNQIRRDNNYHF